MKCIIGLGNPGMRYRKTRHNIGFMVIDELAKRHRLKLNETKFNGKYALEHIGGHRLMLLQPQTFMNLSGECIRPIMEYYNIEQSEIVIIYDDLDLPTGKIRLREQGGHGGHNGVRSTIDQLGTKQFKRIRVGIGRPTKPIPVVDYVLGKFDKNEREDAQVGIQVAADACEAWLEKSFVDVMNEFN